MKLKITLLLSIPLVIGILVVSYIYNLTNPFWRSVHDEVWAGRTSIPISALTNFTWDTVCVLPPYVLSAGNREANIKHLIQGDLNKFANALPNQSHDAAWAFAFIADGNVVAFRKRGHGFWLVKAYKSNCIPKQSAYFIVDGNYVHITHTGENNGGHQK